MRTFNRATKRWAIISMILAIPITLFFLWKINGKIGINEIIITLVILIAFRGIFYLVKLYTNNSSEDD